MTVSQFRSRSLCVHVAALFATSFLISGCSHTFEVKNMSLYKPQFVNLQGKDIRVGISAVTSTPEEERLVMAITNALKREGLKITYPFYSNDENRNSVDYVVKLACSSQYNGSGWNFLINWPGFLVWTPAWHGYKYKVLYGFDADITNTKTNEALPRISSPVELDIRHADMGRTWTELSWLEWSVIAFIGGIMFTRYDHDVTPLLLDHAEYKVGDYVASKIASALASGKTALISHRPYRLVRFVIE